MFYKCIPKRSKTTFKLDKILLENFWKNTKYFLGVEKSTSKDGPMSKNTTKIEDPPGSSAGAGEAPPNAEDRWKSENSWKVMIAREVRNTIVGAHSNRKHLFWVAGDRECAQKPSRNNLEQFWKNWKIMIFHEFSDFQRSSAFSGASPAPAEEPGGSSILIVFLEVGPSLEVDFSTPRKYFWVFSKVFQKYFV